MDNATATWSAMAPAFDYLSPQGDRPVAAGAARLVLIPLKGATATPSTPQEVLSG